ncbi:hypothetical protein BHM03_00054640, partial [Ensete ventricosum]
RRNVHHAARTKDGMEAYDGMRTQARTNRAHSVDTEVQIVPTQRIRKIYTNILALGGPVSQERPPSNTNAEHLRGPNPLPQAEEVIALTPIPNRYWRMLTDPGFSPPIVNSGLPVVIAEDFLGLT